LCTSATLVEPNANQTYLFADGIHPTGAGHAIIAEYAASVLQAPSQIGMLAEAPLASAQTQLRAIDNRLRLTPRAGQAEAYAVYDNTHRTLDRNAGSEGLGDSTNSATVGVDFSVNQDWLVGAAFGFGQNKADFGASSGSFRLNQDMLSAYTQYRHGAWAVNAIGMAGQLDYSDVTRNITLGQALRTEHGRTLGRQLLLRAGGNMTSRWVRLPLVRSPA
jgi:outer membrane lipase/esterase